MAALAASETKELSERLRPATQSQAQILYYLPKQLANHQLSQESHNPYLRQNEGDVKKNIFIYSLFIYYIFIYYNIYIFLPTFRRSYLHLSPTFCRR